MITWTTPGDNPITVYHNSWEDGGGPLFGYEYVEVLQRYSQKFNHCFEWCSGPAFIGFSLLANQICDQLSCQDYVNARESINQTVKENNLNAVKFYQERKVKWIHPTEKFDLVVSNPPHFLECPGNETIQRIKVDKDWQAHREFYENIGQHLTDDAVILMQENMAGSTVEDFREMIESNGFKINEWFKSDNFFEENGHTQIYYIEIVKN